MTPYRIFLIIGIIFLVGLAVGLIVGTAIQVRNEQKMDAPESATIAPGQSPFAGTPSPGGAAAASPSPGITTPGGSSDGKPVLQGTAAPGTAAPLSPTPSGSPTGEPASPGGHPSSHSTMSPDASSPSPAAGKSPEPPQTPAPETESPAAKTPDGEPTAGTSQPGESPEEKTPTEEGTGESGEEGLEPALLWITANKGDGFEVYVNGLPVGKTPVRVKVVPGKTHLVKVVGGEEYTSFSAKVTPGPAEHREIAAVLKMKSPEKQQVKAVSTPAPQKKSVSRPVRVVRKTGTVRRSHGSGRPVIRGTVKPYSR